MKNLSVITVNYNNCAGLENTVRSVLNQSYKDFEYIVVDGGSDDGSVEVIKKYSDKIDKWVSEKDNGIYHAMNKGIKAANGKYCQFLNSGDLLYDKETLSRVFSIQHDEGILYGNIIFDYRNGIKLPRNMPHKLSFKHMVQDTVWHPVSFIRHDIFKKIGFYNERFKIASDYDFFLKAVIVEKVSLFYLDMPIAIYSFDGISSKPSSGEFLKNERKEVQLQYLTEKEINDALKITYLERVVNKLNYWISHIIKPQHNL